MKRHLILCTLLATFLTNTHSDFTHITPEAKIFFEQLETRVSTAQDPYFVVLIPTYKNETIARKNLIAALNQKYSPDCFSILIVNDCSPDNTGKVVAKTLKSYNDPRHTLLINKTKRHGAMYNQYHAAHACPDDAIVVIYDGDDWFAHGNVLERIAQEYRKGAWLTYGQFLWNSCSARGICKPIPAYITKQNLYRKYDWTTSHVRTFYAKLFKKIKKADLMFDGDWIPMAPDVAEMMPMLEMAGPRVHFIDDILYIYNDQNPLSEHHVNRKLQYSMDLYIRSKQPYARLSSL